MIAQQLAMNARGAFSARNASSGDQAAPGAKQIRLGAVAQFGGICCFLAAGLHSA
jgi:hypothetical protein